MPKLRRVAPLLLVAFAVPSFALAQQVVVLEFKGDAKGAVRAQVLDALAKTPGVELVPLKAFAAAAAKKGFRADRLANDAAVKASAPELGLEAVVAGELVTGRLFVQIFDGAGEGIWSRELPLVKGRLGADSAKRLASAISVAATPDPPAAADRTPPAGTEPALPGAAPAATSPQGATAAPSQGAPGPSKTAAAAPPSAPAAASPPNAPTEATTPPPAQAAPEGPPTAPPADGIARPALITAFLTGTTTWRGYCARPGVKGCAEYDALAVGSRPIGETVTFTSQLPYAGYALGLEAFPLARSDAWWRNAVLFARFGQAWSSSTVRVQTTDTSTEPQTVVSLDLAWQLEAGYRHHFFFGRAGDVGYLGGRLGVRTHDFVPEEGTLFGASRRTFPTIGVEGALPVSPRVRLEGGLQLFVNPRAGEDELERYGSRVSGLGFSAQFGASGHVWGPLGYFARLQYEGYADAFGGAGAVWANGGVSEELYLTLLWGLSARY